MTSSKDEVITAKSDVISPDEIAAAYQRWDAPRMVSVSDVEDDSQKMLTVADIEKLQKAAEEDGYKDGFAKGEAAGHQAGMKNAQQEIQKQVAILQQVITRLNTPLADLDQRIEQDLVSMVMTMTRQLVHREFTTNPENVVDAARAAMAVLPVSDRKVKILLNPADIELVKQGLSSDEGDAWQWVESPQLARGDVRIETADTKIDATVESRLKSVIDKLLGEERSDDSAG